MISQTIRKFRVAAAAAVMLAGGMQAATIGASGWMQVSPSGASFSALMPGNPEHAATPVSTALGNITMHSYIVENGNYTYAVFVSDFLFAPPNANQVLDGVSNGYGREGRVIDEKPFTFEGHAGRSITVERDGMMLFNRAFMVDNRLYQVMFGMKKGADVPESANKFITSFRLAN